MNITAIPNKIRMFPRFNFSLSFKYILITQNTNIGKPSGTILSFEASYTI